MHAVKTIVYKVVELLQSTGGRSVRLSQKITELQIRFLKPFKDLLLSLNIYLLCCATEMPTEMEKKFNGQGSRGKPK